MWKTGTTVTHAGPIRYILCDRLGLGEIKIADCAWALLNAKDGHISLEDQEGIQTSSNIS